MSDLKERSRMAGKFGRRPPKNAPALRLGAFLSGQIPQHPDAVDYGSAISDWQMLGNNAAGDCAAVCWANERHAVTTALTSTPTYATQDMVWTVYKSQNPGFVPGHGPHGYESDDDRGMEMQTLQEYLNTTGGADGVKSVAFAKVDVTNREELEAAVAIFGGVSWGVSVTKANEQEFSAGQAWDYQSGSQNLGGHAIYGLGYTAADNEKFITWAAETSFTEAFRQHQVEEAWVTIWPEHLGTKAFEQGVDLAQLKAAYQELTGRVLDVPDQPPAPANSTADAADTALWSATEEFRGSHHLGHSAQQAVTALQSWGQSKGLG